MIRCDIPEGADCAQMPRFGYGRVCTDAALDEWYFTAKLFGYRLFVARGNYTFLNDARFTRYWIRRDP